MFLLTKDIFVTFRCFLYSRHLKQTSAILNTQYLFGEFLPYKADPASHFGSIKFNTYFQLALELRSSTQPRLHQSDAAILGSRLKASEAKQQRCGRTSSDKGGAVVAPTSNFQRLKQQQYQQQHWVPTSGDESFASESDYVQHF